MKFHFQFTYKHHSLYTLRLSHYLAYTELVVARVRAETNSAKQWKVFLLKDYEMPGPTQIDEEGYTLRNKLKKQLKV